MQGIILQDEVIDDLSAESLCGAKARTGPYDCLEEGLKLEPDKEVDDYLGGLSEGSLPHLTLMLVQQADGQALQILSLMALPRGESVS